MVMPNLFLIIMGNILFTLGILVLLWVIKRWLEQKHNK